MQVSSVVNASANSFLKLSFYAFMHPFIGVLLYLMHTGARGGKTGVLVWKDVPFWTDDCNNGQRACIREDKYFNRPDVIARKEAEFKALHPDKEGSDFWKPPPDDPNGIDPKKFFVRTRDWLHGASRDC